MENNLGKQDIDNSVQEQKLSAAEIAMINEKKEQEFIQQHQYEEHFNHFNEVVFIKASPDVVVLSDHIKNLLDRLMLKNYTLILSDGYDSNFFIQHYCNMKRYRNIMIYSICNNLRFNIGKWPVINVWMNKKAVCQDNVLFDRMIHDCMIGVFFIKDNHDKDALPWINKLKKDNKPYYVFSNQ